MRTSHVGNLIMVLVANLLVFVMAMHAWGQTTWTYTGDGVDPAVWSDENNWLKDGVVDGYPTETTGNTVAMIPDGKGPAFDSAVSNIYRLQTGNTHVSFAGGISCHNDAPHSPSITVGSGGMTVNGNVWTSRGPLILNGNTTITGNLQFWQQGLTKSPGTTLTLGGNFIIGEQANFTIGNWTFGAPYNGTFSVSSIYSGRTVTWAGTPDFAGGRPNYNLTQGGDNGATWNVADQTLLGNALTIGNWPGGGTRHSRLLVSGGTVDVNTLTVNANGAGFTAWNHIVANNADFYIRGATDAWNIRTIGNENFDITDNTTVHLVPDGGTISIHTGSKDRGGNNASDWDDNFAFGNLRIAAGATVTVTGNANIEGGDPSAVYVKGTLYGEHGSAIIGGRNIYVYGGLEPGSSAGTLTIDGNLHLWETALLTFDLADPNVVGGGVNDLVAIDGDLTLNGLLEVNLDDPMLLGNYTLFTYTGDLYGNGLELLTELPKYAFVDTSVAGIVTLNVVPEPTSLVLLALGALGLLKRMRKP